MYALLRSLPIFTRELSYQFSLELSIELLIAIALQVMSLERSQKLALISVLTGKLHLL